MALVPRVVMLTRIPVVLALPLIVDGGMARVRLRVMLMILRRLRLSVRRVLRSDGGRRRRRRG